MERAARRAIDPAIRQMFLGNDPCALVPSLRQIDREPGFDDDALSRVQLPVLSLARETTSDWRTPARPRQFSPALNWQ